MKVTKKLLSVVLALAMLLSLMPNAFAALTNSVDQQGNASVGTVTLDLRIFALDTATNTWTPVADDAKVAPGTILKVVVGGSTDFWTGPSQIQVFYDKTLYTPWNYMSKAVCTTSEHSALSVPGLIEWCTQENGYNLNIDRDAANNYVGSKLYTDAINFTESGARVNPLLDKANRNYWPLGWRDTSQENYVSTSADEYGNMTYVWVNIAVTAGSKNDQNDGLGARLFAIEDQDFFAFYLKASDAVSSDTAAPIMIPGVAIKGARTYANGHVSFSKNSTYAYTGSTETAVGTGFYFNMQEDNANHINDFIAVSNLTIGQVETTQTYTASFFAENGQEINIYEQSDLEAGTAITLPAGPSVTGKNFAGWSDGSNVYAAGTSYTVNGDVSFTATYTTATYTVTFYAEDGTTVLSTQTVAYGGSATAPTPPTVTGKTFTGWSTRFDNITANTNVIARYSVNKCAVSFDGVSTNYDYGTVITMPNVSSTPENTVFTGWSDGEHTYQAGTEYTVTGDVAFTSTFASTVAAYTINVYKQNTDGRTYAITQIPATGSIGTTVSVDPATYLETGFVYDADESEPSGVVLEEGTLELVLVYNRESYTVNYYSTADGSNWTLFDSETVVFGNDAALPTATPATYTIGDYDYVFSGWELDGVPFTGVDVAANCNVRAKFDPIPNTLIYTALNAAAEEFADTILPENLYFYTDTAISAVATAFGWSSKSVADYLSYIKTNGYTCNLKGSYAHEDAAATVVPTDQAEIDAMTAAITDILATITKVENAGQGAAATMPYRAENKATVTVKTVADKTTARPGDVVTFSVYAKTNFYVSALSLPILYDANVFAPYINGAAATQAALAAGDYDDDLSALSAINTAVIGDNYSIEDLYFDSDASYYPAGTSADTMAQYKVIYVLLLADADAEIFDDENGVYLFSYQLKVLDNAADGTYTIGEDSAWQATSIATANNKLAALRATSATDTDLPDSFAQFGQTFTLENASVTVANVVEYTVTFYAADGTTVLKTETVAEGGAATAPTTVPTIEGKNFTGWDKDFSNVTSNLDVIAQYEDIVTYTVILHTCDDDYLTYVYTETFEAGAEFELPTNIQVEDDNGQSPIWVDITNGGLYEVGDIYTVDGDAEFYMLGDVNGDGAIDATDVTLLSRLMVGLIDIEDVLSGDAGIIWQAANVSGYDAALDLEEEIDYWEDYLDASDVTLLSRYLVGLDVTFG